MSEANTLDVLASDPSITYLPAGAWNSTEYYGNLSYAWGNAQVLYTFAEPATGIAWYGSKSGSGGNAQVCIDCPFNGTTGFLVDYTDPTAGGYLPEPGVIAAWTNLSYAIHNITITNLFDPQANNGQGDYGWLYFLGFELTGTNGSNAGNDSQPTAAISVASAAATSASATSTSVPANVVTVTQSITQTDFVTVTATAPTSVPTHSTSFASKVATSRAWGCVAILALLVIGSGAF